jgi:hypothetical protein
MWVGSNMTFLLKPNIPHHSLNVTLQPHDLLSCAVALLLGLMLKLQGAAQPLLHASAEMAQFKLPHAQPRQLFLVAL